MEDRLHILEAQIRQMRRAISIFALLLLFMIFLTLFKNRDIPNELQVSSVDIVNDSGEVVVHLGVRSSGAGGIWVTDEVGQKLLKLNQDESGGVITILASDGSEAQIITVPKQEGGDTYGSQ